MQLELEAAVKKELCRIASAQRKQTDLGWLTGVFLYFLILSKVNVNTMQKWISRIKKKIKQQGGKPATIKTRTKAEYIRFIRKHWILVPVHVFMTFLTVAFSLVSAGLISKTLWYDFKKYLEKKSEQKM